MEKLIPVISQLFDYVKRVSVMVGRVSEEAKLASQEANKAIADLTASIENLNNAEKAPLSLSDKQVSDLLERLNAISGKKGDI
jgi:hypothetical protein